MNRSSKIHPWPGPLEKGARALRAISSASTPAEMLRLGDLVGVIFSPVDRVGEGAGVALRAARFNHMCAKHSFAPRPAP